jgi:hypothetical protein
MPWLPYADLIHAWQLLQTGDSISKAVERLLQSVGRGVPLYTEGVRLLIDGLELTRHQSTALGLSTPVEGALAWIRRYAGAIDWNQSLTTFNAWHPSEPSLSIITGVPEDSGPIRFLGQRAELSRDERRAIQEAASVALSGGQVEGWVHGPASYQLDGALDKLGMNVSSLVARLSHRSGAPLLPGSPVTYRGPTEEFAAGWQDTDDLWNQPPPDWHDRPENRPPH